MYYSLELNTGSMRRLRKMNNQLIIDKYIEKGHTIIKEKYWSEYDKIVPIRVNDLYHGFELDAFLEIVKCYDDTKDLDKCNLLFDRQNHSGMSASLVATLIYHYHDEGDKIVRRLGYECKDKEVTD